jgi:hypothetical protein
MLAAAAMALAVLAIPAGAEETGADIPKNSYYKDPLTISERSGIAEEEDVSPNDGRPSVPPTQDQGVIPDAADKADSKAALETPAQNLEEDVNHGVKKGESEADAILDESKKSFKVTNEDMANCMRAWDAQSQMSKSEWAESCRTTLEYFPDGK